MVTCVRCAGGATGVAAAAVAATSSMRRELGCRLRGPSMTNRGCSCVFLNLRPQELHKLRYPIVSLSMLDGDVPPPSIGPLAPHVGLHHPALRALAQLYAIVGSVLGPARRGRHARCSSVADNCASDDFLRRRNCRVHSSLRARMFSHCVVALSGNKIKTNLVRVLAKVVQCGSGGMR